MDINNLLFRRKFAFSLYKNLKLKLAEADFSKPVTEEGRGDKYPLMFSCGEFTENVSGGRYYFSGGTAARYISPLYHYAVNEVDVRELDGECGFVFTHGGDTVKITLGNTGGLYVLFECGGRAEKTEVDFAFTGGIKLGVLVRKACFDVYIDRGGFPEYICTFTADEFKDSSREDFFKSASVGLVFSGSAVCGGASVYHDSGISQADIRPVCYENGEVMTENGRVFLTASLRMQENGCQGVFAWVPGTAEFELTGVLFFDAGDGVWENDVATCLVYDRSRKKWLLWVCSFSHGHILGHAEFDGEPRYGRNVIDITLVKNLPEGADDTVFGGKQGDEDPALTFDEKRGKWLLAVCRVCKEGGYRYFFFESDDPFENFEFAGSGAGGGETGGSFFRCGGELYFICGKGFNERARYRAYNYGSPEDFKLLRYDRDDGGFRGWGSVFKVKRGARECIYQLTFDRCRGSEYNWSYGNIYCFEATI